MKFKIKQIQGSGMSKDKSLYQHEVEMESGEIGISWSKNESPPYGAGDEVEGEHLEKNGFKYFKGLKKPGQANYSRSNGRSYDKVSDDTRQLLIVRQSSLKEALNYLNQKGEPIEGMHTVLEVAEVFVKWVMSGDINESTKF